MKKNIIAIAMVIVIIGLTFVANKFLVPFVLIPVELNNNLSVIYNEHINKKELLEDIVKVYSNEEIMYAQPSKTGLDSTVSMNVYWRKQYSGDGYHVYAQEWTNDNGNNEIIYHFLSDDNQMIYSYKNETTAMNSLIRFIIVFALAVIFVYNIVILITSFIKKKK